MVTPIKIEYKLKISTLKSRKNEDDRNMNSKNKDRNRGKEIHEIER